MVMLAEAATPSAPSDGETLTIVGNDGVLEDMGLLSPHPASQADTEVMTMVARRNLPAFKLTSLV